MTVFTLSKNPITGSRMWEERDEYYDFYQDVATASFADMLHDHERNQKYFIAIKSAIDKMHRENREAHVLDIGAGTGLLSMMAARCGADTIVACEVIKPMAECAQKIIRDNGLEEKIKLIHKHSTELSVGENGDLPRQANILVTEVFDTELIGECALSIFIHAHKYLLEKDCIVVPNKGTIWVQVVQSKALSSWNRIRPIRNKNDKSILIDVPHPMKTCSGARILHDVQLSQVRPDLFKPLSPAQPMFRFDWSGKTPLELDEKISLCVDTVSSGTADALFMWWDLNMDPDDRVLLSCAPVWEHPDAKEYLLDNREPSKFAKLADEIPWRDHWMQAVYFFNSEISVEPNQPVNLIGCHDECSFWFDLRTAPKYDIEELGIPMIEGRDCECGVHMACWANRMAQLSDERRNSIYLEALRDHVNENTVCLCLSEGSLLSLAASRFGAKKVYVLETNLGSRRCTEAFLEANGLTGKVQIVESTDTLPPETGIDLIFAEPHFVSSIMPWDNLRYWYIASTYSQHVKRILLAATVMAVAVEFENLHKICAPVGYCEGFDMSAFDNLIQTSRDKCNWPVDTHPLWEYPAKALTAPFVLAKLDLTSDVNDHENVRLSDSIPILANGQCNGVAIWVDWELCSGCSVTTGAIENVVPGRRVSWDPNTSQGVYFFPDAPRVTTNRDSVSWSFSFKPKIGCIDFRFDISSSG